MRNVIQLRTVVFAWLLALWGVAAWAAESTFAKDIGSYPIEAIQLTIFLSFIGGLAFTTNKISKPEIIVKNVWLEMAKDIISSMVAGLITFFFSTWVGTPSALQAVFITIAGFGGSRTLDKFLNDAFFSWIDRSKPPAPTQENKP